MKRPAAMCLVVLLSAHCPTFARTPDLCNSSASSGVEEFVWSKEALHRYRTAFAPLAGEHDLTLGDCGALYSYGYVFETCSLADAEDGIVTTNFTVQFDENVLIGCIGVIDIYTSGDEGLGGYPFVDGGGLGFNYVDLKFVSQEGQGMHFFSFVFAEVERTTTEVATTTKPSSGNTLAVGKFWRNWFMLFMLCVVTGGHIF